VGDFLLQEGHDRAVDVKVDFVAADIPDGAFVFGFVHLADTEPDAVLVRPGQELRFDGLFRFFLYCFHHEKSYMNSRMFARLFSDAVTYAVRDAHSLC